MKKRRYQSKNQILVKTGKAVFVILFALIFLTAGYCIDHWYMRNELEQRDSIYQKRLEQSVPAQQTDKYVAVSLDDTIEVFRDLSQNSNRYSSIFENETLSYLESLHKLYGVVFSMYCYYETDDGEFNLSMMTEQYKEQFVENSDWLRWGFHSYNGDTYYDEVDVTRAENDYQKLVSELERVVGTESIERVIRLNGFRGNYENIQIMSEQQLGIVGILGADDDRNSYFLDENQSQELKEQGRFEQNNISFLATDLRVENIKDVKTEFDNLDNEIIVFSHEWQLKDRKVRTKLEQLLMCAVENDFVFDFPRN